jgi:hypothetical protein
MLTPPAASSGEHGVASDCALTTTPRQNAISIALTDAVHADASDKVHPRAIVALEQGAPVEVQILYPDLGLAAPLAAAAERYGLDGEALLAAAKSALAAPDRVVTVEVQARTHA